MQMKRFLAWLLVLAMCFMLAACNPDTNSKAKPEKDATESTSQKEADTSKNDASQPLLYRVTDKSGNVLWLFGSIHVGREDYYPLPDYVLNAFHQSDSLAVELDIVAFEKDMSAQMSAILPLVYQDGTTISDHIPKELYDKCVDILKEYNSYLSGLDIYCPAFWSSMIDSLMVAELGGDVDLGIDRHLLDLANKANKEILEIESAKFQYQMMADFDDDVQIALLESSVESYEDKKKAKEDLKDMMDLWASGDEKAFAEYLAADDEDMTEEEKQSYAKYEKAMLTDRNLSMAQYARQALASGKEVFICVGAAHIVGEGAVVDLLEEQGYIVECITK